MPNKPDKYGVQLELMCDSNSYYLVSGILYIGKTTDTKNLSLDDYFAKLLKSKPIHGTNFTITIDNRFTSVHDCN